MEDSFEQIRVALPPYLSAESKKELLAQLRSYPANAGYYGSIPGETEPVQGDAWRGLSYRDFDTGQREDVVGFVISNSCDIAASNLPDPAQKVLFAPLLDLEMYLRFLRDSGKTQQQVDELLVNIRKQEIHRILYLPTCPKIAGESIVLLDDLYSQPLQAIDSKRLERVFTLSNFGWYVLLIKLSIHFTRMQERLERKAAS